MGQGKKDCGYGLELEVLVWSYDFWNTYMYAYIHTTDANLLNDASESYDINVILTSLGSEVRG